MPSAPRPLGRSLADKSVPESEKREDLAQLEAALKDAKPVQFKENIARQTRPQRGRSRPGLRLAKPMNGINAPQRPDCVAGHVRFELRNVVANYPFENSRRFAGNQPNSGQGDHSRLSCNAGDTQLGPAASIPHPAPSRTRSSKDVPPAAKPATPLLSLRWTFRAKRACVVITDAEPARLAPLTPPAPMGLRGVWVVAARCCASPPALLRRRS